MANDGLVNMVNMANLWKPPFVRFMKCGMPKSPWGFKKHFNGHPWRLDVWGYPHFRFHLHLFWKSIPSGKRLHNYGKSPFLLGKLTISMAMFNSYVAVYQRVHISIWKSMNPHPTISISRKVPTSPMAATRTAPCCGKVAPDCDGRWPCLEPAKMVDLNR